MLCLGTTRVGRIDTVLFEKGIDSVSCVRSCGFSRDSFALDYRDRENKKSRESGFNLKSCANAKLPEYNALLDSSLKHHFENRQIQKQLQSIGMIDSRGRVVDLDRNRAKLAIIEQEFKLAEKAEFMRKREEEEMRRRVRKKRLEELEKARHRERLRKMKEDSKIRREMLSLASPYHEAMYSKSPSPVHERKSRKAKITKKKKQSSRNDDGSGTSFFMTESH